MRKAFTLVELLVVIALLLMGVLVFFTLRGSIDDPKGIVIPNQNHVSGEGYIAHAGDFITTSRKKDTEPGNIKFGVWKFETIDLNVENHKGVISIIGYEYESDTLPAPTIPYTYTTEEFKRMMETVDVCLYQKDSPRTVFLAEDFERWRKRVARPPGPFGSTEKKPGEP